MPGSRRGSRASTTMLVLWGSAMLLLGLGMGLYFSGPGRDPAGRSNQEKREPVRKKPAAVKKDPVPEPAVPKVERREPAKEPTLPMVEPKNAGERKREPESPLPRFALVIDDLGYASPELVTKLCALDIPFSVAVLPFLEFSRQSAEIAFARKKEVILHLPMEPIGYPGPSKDPGPGAVMYDLSENDLRQRVRFALDAVPHAKGVNNHMGSRITPDRKRMTWILEEIRARRCFFLDSRTEKDSVAFEVAEFLKIPSAQRKVFLDDNKDFSEMSKQWDRALGIASKEGQVIIIGHIYPETVAALEALIPRSKGEVKFVFAGTLTE